MRQTFDNTVAALITLITVLVLALLTGCGKQTPAYTINTYGPMTVTLPKAQIMPVGGKPKTVGVMRIDDEKNIDALSLSSVDIRGSDGDDVCTSDGCAPSLSLGSGEGAVFVNSVDGKHWEMVSRIRK